MTRRNSPPLPAKIGLSIGFVLCLVEITVFAIVFGPFLKWIEGFNFLRKSYRKRWRDACDRSE